MKRFQLIALLGVALVVTGFTAAADYTLPVANKLKLAIQQFYGGTGVNFMRVPDNQALALTIEDFENGGDVARLRTTNSDESLLFVYKVGFSFGAATAGATQTQAGATALTAQLSKVTTTSANDGVALPAGTAPMCVMICNLSANNLKVYGANADDDTIDGGSADASVTQAASAKSVWYCTANGVAWTSFQ